MTRSIRIIVTVMLALSAVIPTTPATSHELEPECTGLIDVFDEETCKLAFAGFPILMEAEFTPLDGAQLRDEWELHMEVLVAVANTPRSIAAECAETGAGTLRCQAYYQPDLPASPVAVPADAMELWCLTHLHDLQRVTPPGAYGSGSFRCASGDAATAG